MKIRSVMSESLFLLLSYSFGLLFQSKGHFSYRVYKSIF